MKTALSIAGVDPSGGAGIFADTNVFIAHKVYAMGVITATTAQNTKGIFGMQLINPKMISDGINAIFDDIKVDVIKIGVVPSVDIIKSVANTLRNLPKCPPIILDPVISCKNDDGNMSIWLEKEGIDAILEYLFPLASVITPNKIEAQVFSGIDIKTRDDAKLACEKLLNFKAKSVCLKAGEMKGKSVDLFYDGTNFVVLDKLDRLNTIHTHGSGCSLSSAIASNIANEDNYIDAVKKAKDYVFEGIKSAKIIGQGHNPINHFHNF